MSFKEPKYNSRGWSEDGKKAIEEAISKFAAKALLPTTAAADIGMKLPEALMQVDPAMLSQVLPNMYKQFMQIRNLMNSFNSQQSSSGSTSSAYQITIMTNVFTGVLALISKKFGFLTTLQVMFSALDNGKYSNILPNYQNIVLIAIVDLIKLAKNNGYDNIPYPTIPQLVYNNNITPSPIYPSYDAVPDYYIQQYYTIETDPYIGYIQWLGPTGDYIYTKRTLKDPPYVSAEVEIITTAQIQFAGELYKYFYDNNLTVDVLNILLPKYCQQIQNNNLDKNMGKNSQINILQLLSQLAGIAGILANLTQNNHLPKSVLNVSSVSASLDAFKQSIGQIKKLKSLSQTAFTGNIDTASLGIITSALSAVKSAAKIG